LLLVLSLLLAVATGSARAQDPYLDEEEARIEARLAEAVAPSGKVLHEAGETIYVWEDAEVRRARDQIGIELRELGYRKHHSRNGRDVYANVDSWKPWVIVDDDGWVMVRRAPVTFSKPRLPGIWRGPLGYLVCVVNPTACVHVGGLIVSKRKLNPRKREVIETIEPAVQRYEEALIERGMQIRTNEVIPDLLDAIWESGLSPGHAEPLATWAERRGAVVEFWQTRVDDAYGDRAREVVEVWSRATIQSGEHPFTDDEIARARAERRCSRPVDGLFVEPPP
jgi:hypothetical protein